jgi:hypothetical protein
MPSLPSRYSVGVDWVTLTYAPGTSTYSNSLRDGRTWVRDWCSTFANGFETKPWRMMGYAGWQHGSARIGRRDDSAIAVVSGAIVGKPTYLPQLDEARCTRLDIRIDCYYDGEKPELAAAAYSETLEYRRGKGGRPYLVDYRHPSPGSATLYIGARTSPAFIRIYDKEAESGGDAAYKGCWRVEVELKEDAANETFHALRAGDFNEDALTACVLTYCEARGVRFPDWSYDRWDAYAAGAGLVTDVARKLNWLSTTVAPSVRFLLRNCRTADIVSVLGLQNYVTIKEDAHGREKPRWFGNDIDAD